jgi:hypothetical protein
MKMTGEGGELRTPRPAGVRLVRRQSNALSGRSSRLAFVKLLTAQALVCGFDDALRRKARLTPHSRDRNLGIGPHWVGDSPTLTKLPSRTSMPALLTRSCDSLAGAPFDTLIQPAPVAGQVLDNPQHAGRQDIHARSEDARQLGPQEAQPLDPIRRS